jgi:hypothetical protein
VDGAGLSPRCGSTLVVGAPLAALVLLLPTEASADGVEGPALVAWLPTYNQDVPDVAVHGSGCHNRPERMPAGRESACGKPELGVLGTGRYAIDVDNAAPFPETAEDGGHAVFVAAVGTNAHCFEESTTFTGDALRSLVRCVSPESGEDVDSPFSWSYRADNLDFPQQGDYSPNFAYARVEKDGSLVPEESFNPLDVDADDVLVEKNQGAGDYTVTFRGLNPLDGSLDPVLAPYNVLVQKTCSGDTSGGSDASGCFRAECVPYAWTPGDFERWDTMVDVRCYGADGSPRDTGFRVLVGSEGHTSQRSWDGGYRFGWLDWNADPSAPGCLASPDIVGTSQHETPVAYYPGEPVEACRSDVGVYQANFLGGDIVPYAIDGMTPVVSSRGLDGAFCNASSLECGDNFPICALPDAPPTTRITIRCFDRTGAPADSAWNVNMTY